MMVEQNFYLASSVMEITNEAFELGIYFLQQLLLHESNMDFIKGSES
jgi:hypothetical protein